MRKFVLAALAVCCIAFLLAAKPRMGAAPTPGELTGGGPGTGSPPAIPRGYFARDCGFDLNDNGLIGEAEDCNICDAGLSGGIIQSDGTIDPDGDGTNEDIFYVDCTAGTDADPDCGLAGEPPCLTIEHAFNVRAAASNGAIEDIVCFTGTCNTTNSSAVADVRITVNGLPTHFTKTRTGSQVRDWQYPSNPVMLVGWDRDQDNQFPPWDTDDTSVIDSPDQDEGFQNLPSYSEFAHFDWIDASTNDGGGTGSGFIFKPNNSTARSHIYIHDIEVDGLNEANSVSQSEIGINMFTHPGLAYFSIENSRFDAVGGFFVRGGSTSAPVSGPWRFQNLTVNQIGCTFGPAPCDNNPSATVVMSKVWGHIDGQEWLDSIYDAQPDLWSSVGSQQTGAGGALQCVQDVVFRNNYVIDYDNPFGVQPWDSSGQCAAEVDARPVTDVVVDNNTFEHTYGTAVPGGGHIGIVVAQGGPLFENRLADMTVHNNTFSDTSSNTRRGVELRGGNDEATHVGTVTITDNTFTYATLSGAIIYVDDVTATFPRDDIVISGNNVNITATSPGFNIDTEYVPAGWSSNDNCFDLDSEFSWNGGASTDLATWVMNSGDDDRSVAQNSCP